MKYTDLDEDTCKEFVQEFMKLYDTNEDGEMDLEEFTNMITTLAKDVPVDAANIEKKFNEIDANGNGILDEDELSAAIFEMLNEGLGDQEENESFEEAEQNSDDE